MTDSPITEQVPYLCVEFPCYITFPSELSADEMLDALYSALEKLGIDTIGIRVESAPPCRICGDPCPIDVLHGSDEQVCCSEHLEDLIMLGWTTGKHKWCTDPECTECDQPGGESE
jgi:hypothetical protein